MSKEKTVNCRFCEKTNLSFNEIGLCKKLLGRNIETFMCLNCLAEYLEVTSEELLSKMEEFKGQGCKLFK